MTSWSIVEYIITGYKIGGRTWISDAWNDGTLTREMVREQMEQHDPRKQPTDEELRADLLESEAEIIREEFEQKGNTTPYDELMNDWIETQMDCIHGKQAAERDIYEALVDLEENWTDDTEDEDQFERVCVAHNTLDTYGRRLAQMEFEP
jgi:hypothetical protein